MLSFLTFKDWFLLPTIFAVVCFTALRVYAAPTLVEDFFVIENTFLFSFSENVFDNDLELPPETLVTALIVDGVSYPPNTSVSRGSGTMNMTTAGEFRYSGEQCSDSFPLRYEAEANGISLGNASITLQCGRGFSEPGDPIEIEPSGPGNDLYSSTQGEVLRGNILENDLSLTAELYSYLIKEITYTDAELAGGITLNEGVLTIDSTGDLSFEPASGFVGVLQIVYTVPSRSLVPITATITLEILPEVMTVPDEVEVAGERIEFDLLRNDQNIDTLSQITYNGEVYAPGEVILFPNGTLVIEGDGRGVLTVTTPVTDQTLERITYTGVNTITGQTREEQVQFLLRPQTEVILETETGNPVAAEAEPELDLVAPTLIRTGGRG